MISFTNEPLLDFTIARVRDEFRKALESVESKILAKNFRADPLIDGTVVSAEKVVARNDPSNKDLVVGTVGLAGSKEVSQALDSLRQGKRKWEETQLTVRQSILRKAAQLMRDKKLYLAALIVREVGKPWKEADADLAEAIDFCDYYAALSDNLRPQLTQNVPGEENWYSYQPRGCALVIAPWNFPLAIACGMTVAALVTGNVTILKPAEQSSLIAFEFGKILYEAGIPPDAFALLPGEGETVGRALVSHPDIDIICFTGSKAVGLEIIKNSAEVREGQRGIKKVIAELGGKNAIIVDDDADLDEAIKGVMYSSFGFAGQKCSACSRVIIIGSAYEPFLERLKQAAKDITIGSAADSASTLGPVIDSEAYQRIMNSINEAKLECKILSLEDAPQNGYYIAPAIFRDVTPQHKVWRDEIFGPVVACAKASSFSDAVCLANDSEYALTGGLFSRNPAHIELAKREFKVGNLYINRGCTGALVCRQPFGGFKMSGIGSKAGGPDYLLQFVEPKTVTENTMRRGFAPE